MFLGQAMARPVISSTCHPAEKHCAKGLCKNCYYRIYSKQRRMEGKDKDTRPPRIQDSRDYRVKRPMRVWLAEIKSKYGLTFRDYIHLLEEQDCKCAICGSSGFVGQNKRAPFTVDHDHASNKVRGLLCGLCNMGLGCFKDSQILFDRASQYLLNPPIQKIEFRD